jgi:hypothetical protein
MTAKEKAKELLYKYYVLAESIEWSDKDTQKKAEKYNDDLGEDVEYYWHELAKRSALIAVDEILGLIFLSQAEINYWHEVKHEIKQL